MRVYQRNREPPPRHHPAIHQAIILLFTGPNMADLRFTPREIDHEALAAMRIACDRQVMRQENREMFSETKSRDNLSVALTICRFYMNKSY